MACWWSCGRARASLWDLVGAAISTPEVGLPAIWVAAGGAAVLGASRFVTLVPPMRARPQLAARLCGINNIVQ